jgi:hypothetical protein
MSHIKKEGCQVEMHQSVLPGNLKKAAKPGQRIEMVFNHDISDRELENFAGHVTLVDDEETLWKKFTELAKAGKKPDIRSIPPRGILVLVANQTGQG